MTTTDLRLGAALRYVKESLTKYNDNTLVGPEAVAEVLRYGTHDDCRNDLYSFAAVVRLTYGKFAAVEGTCDYTGFDCQAGLSTTVHDTEEEAWLNVTVDGRAMIEREEAS